MPTEIRYLAWRCLKNVRMEVCEVLMYTHKIHPQSLYSTKHLLSFLSTQLNPDTSTVTSNSFALKHVLLLINLNCKSWYFSAWISSIPIRLLLTLLGQIHVSNKIHPVLGHQDPCSIASLPCIMFACWFQSTSPLPPPWWMATELNYIKILDLHTRSTTFPQITINLWPSVF